MRITGFLKRLQSLVLAVAMFIGIVAVSVPASAAAPVIKNISFNESRTAVNIEFTDTISEIPGVKIKDMILYSEGNDGEFQLPAGTNVTVKARAIAIEFTYPITASRNYFVIKKGALANMTANIKTPVISGLDPALISLDGADIDSTRKVVTLKFTSAIAGYPSDDALKNGFITMATDAKNYNTTVSASQIDVRGEEGEIVITFSKALDGENNRFKIAAGKLQNTENGNLNLQPIYTPSIDATVSNAPKLVSTSIDKYGSTVTLTFDQDIKRASAISISALKGYVNISRQGAGFTSLSSNDEVEISGKTLKVLLYSELRGNNNRIRVSRGAIVSAATGDAIKKEIYTDYINLDGDGGDGGPQYKKIIYDKDDNKIRIYFDRKIYNATDEKLINGIEIYKDGAVTWSPLKDVKDVEIYNENSILITLILTLDTNTRFRITSGTIEDANGNRQNTNIYTDFVNQFGGGDYTQEIIDEEDEPTREPEQNQPEQNVPEVNEPEDDTPQADVPSVDATTSYLNGVAIDLTESTFSYNSTGEKIYDVKVSSDKALPILSTKTAGLSLDVVLPDDANGATVSVPGDVMNILTNLDATISVECVNAIEKIPASLLSIANIKKDLGDTQVSNADISVVITVSRAASAYDDALDVAVSKIGATVIAEPVEFTIGYKAKTTSRRITKFNEYMAKSFAVNKKVSSNATIVRIEASGNVNHVPTYVSRRQNGESYLQARTRSNGVYAVISSNRSFSDTPTWAVPAVSALGARNILVDFTGTTLNPSKAATRAEVSGIITRAIGVYTDKSGASKFLDVTLTDPYYTSTAVAVEYGLINGYGDNTFKPDRNITRQEAAVILARTLRLVKSKTAGEITSLTTTQANTVISKFADKKDVASWAVVDVAECVQAGIIRGDNNNKVNPNANVTRAEVVQMVYNLLTQYGFINK